jgi:hypothetical protein
MFASGCFGYHLYTTNAASRNITLRGNVTFLNGRLSDSPDYFEGGGANHENLTVEANYSYHIDRTEATIFLGWFSDGGSTGLVYRNNYLVGGESIMEWSDITESGNTLIGPSDTPSDVVFVRPNGYEAGRGHVVVYNWSGAGSQSADLSDILEVGDAYEIHSHLDLWGTPVASGTYAGGSVSIPMTAIGVPSPIMGPPGTSTPGPEFGVFLVRKVG